jgi:hypothetical protein
MLYPARLFKGSAAFRCFALALCSRYSGTRSALTGFAGSLTGRFFSIETKSVQGTREHTSALAAKNFFDVQGSLRGFAFR